MSSPAFDQNSIQYLSFLLDGEAYAIGILRVREILEYQPPTRVPQTPPSIRGVINLRGKVIPIVDLAVKFGLPPTKATKWTCIIVTETTIAGESAVMGVLADAVSEVVDLPAADIEPPPSFGTRVKVDFLLGLGRAAGQKFVLLLDIDRILSADEVGVAASPAAAAAVEGAAKSAGA